MVRVSWAVLALLVGLGIGVSALAGGIPAGASIAASAVTVPIIEPTVEPSPSLDATPLPSLTLDETALPKPPMPVGNVKERLDEVRQDVKGRVEQRREGAKDRMNQVKVEADKRREDFQAQGRPLQDMRGKAVMDFRLLEANLEAKVRNLRSKPRLNESEKAELADASKMHAEAAFNQRIALAQKLESEGANASWVSGFVSYAEDARSRFLNASNNTARNDVIVEFNRRWAEFKQAVTDDLLVAKLQTSVNASRQVLTRLDAVIAKLSFGGFNTSALINASAAIAVRLDSVMDAPDVPQAVSRLRQVHAGLVHLRQAIQRTLNHELVDAYRELPAPSVKVDASLRIGAVRTSPIPAGLALPSTPPTMGQGDVGGSVNPSPA